MCKFVGVDLKFVGTRSLTRVIHIEIYIYICIFGVFLRVHVLRGSNVYIQYLCG